MSNKLPKIDQRDQNFIVNELRNLILQYCPEWKTIEEIKEDQQVDALVHIFANMMDKVIDRLNNALDRNFIEFLNMIGISPTPPRVAKAPLVFKLKDDWDSEVLIPAGTKVSAQPENQEEVIFETDKDLMVIKPNLVRAVSINPSNDSWSNQDFIFDMECEDRETELFKGDSRVVHRLYIGHKNLFNFEESKGSLTISFNEKVHSNSSKIGVEKELEFEWYSFDKDGNLKKLEPKKKSTYVFTFDNIVSTSIKSISGYSEDGRFRNWENRWLLAQSKTPITNDDMIPDIEDTEIKLEIVSSSNENKDNFIYVESAIYNDTPINMSKDFYPFGEKPKINDAFYIASKEAFSKAGSKITLSVELSDSDLCKIPDTEYVKLYWEYWNGSTWKTIEIDSNKESEKDNQGQGKDVIHECILRREKGDNTLGTACTVTASGEIKFKCPDIKSCVINGEDNYWIRARITGGNYGSDEEYEYIKKEITVGNEKVNISEMQYKKPSFSPPSIKKLTIQYKYIIQDSPDNIISENNYTFTELANKDMKWKKVPFKPFLPCYETDQTLYLAFDKDISNLPISLFFPLTGDQLGKNPIIAWEYWNGEKWLSLSVSDTFKNFTRREILQFVSPNDLEEIVLFGTKNYWIRARIEEGGFEKYPKISKIYTNAVWSRNSNTLNKEILGSSNGEPNQTFKLSRNPVLVGQELRIQETLIQEEWQSWEEVKTFSLSNTDSRHYMMDHTTGIITFGDGLNGMVPPAGVDNIMCSYKQGGGSVGNVEKNTIKNIWDKFSGIDSVNNPIPADGGFDQEKPEEAKVRGPHTLKSWERGITCEDVEWMVHEVAPQTSIVKCLPTMDVNLNFVPGKATVIVVPEYDDLKPMPSQELLNEIELYLSERISAVLNRQGISCIHVTGPKYIRVGVDATVTYTSPEKGKIIEGKIIDNLKQFLNPISGGQEKTGWELGHNLYVSEVNSIIKNTPGVDYISNINIKSSTQCFTLNLERLKDGYFRTEVPYPKYSALMTSDNRIILALAEDIIRNKEIKSLKVKGFNENMGTGQNEEEKNWVRLTSQTGKFRYLNVLSVDGDVLECSTKDENPLQNEYKKGSILEAEMNGLIIKTFILNNISKDSKTFFIKIAVPEAHDTIFLCRDDEYVNTTPLKVLEVKSEDIFLEKNELVYNGIHFINKKTELIFPYLMNDDTGVVYDLSSRDCQFNIDQIPREDRIYFRRV